MTRADQNACSRWQQMLDHARRDAAWPLHGRGPMNSAHAFRLRDRRMPAVALAAIAIATVVFSRVVLRSERQLAAPAAGWPLLVVAGTLAAIAVHWIRAVVRGRFHALSSVELALASCVVCACIAALAMP